MSTSVSGSTISTGGVNVGADKHFVYNQIVAASVWVVVHALGKQPAVQVFDSGGTQVVGQIEFDTPNQITLTFSAAFAGKAILN